MIRNYFRIAFRNLIKHKAYSTINITGLAIGMACSIIILLWVQHELSYDRFHKNADQIYRITARASQFDVAVNPAAMPGGLMAELPVIKNFVRTSYPIKTLFETNNRKFEEKDAYYVDSTFFDLFSFTLVKGDPNTALDRPDAVLLTRAMAKKYFGNEDPIGKVLKRNANENVTVTGILENVPSNSHLQFDFIMPISAIANSESDLKNNVWDNFNYFNYLLLDKNFVATRASIKQLNDEMDRIYKKHVKDLEVNFSLQPLKDIHLYSRFNIDLPGRGNIQYVNILFLVAIFILVVACINFMNLATARSARRAKEVGLRKVVGAARRQLIFQFLGESMIITFIALILAIGMVFLFLPAFNNIAGKQFSISLFDGKLFIGIIGIALITGLLSGSYPALFLSKFSPANVLKGSLRTGGGNRYFRNGLVITQFIVSIVLMAGTIAVYQQLQYIRTRDLGFDKENIIYMPMTGEIWGKQQALRAELQKNPLTRNYTMISEPPIDITGATVNIDWEGKDPKAQNIFATLHIAENFDKVFEMKMLAGRAYSPEFKGDSNGYIVNEKAMAVMGFNINNVIGKRFGLWGRQGTIIGVVKDFNYKPIQQPIEPLVMLLNQWGGNIVVRTAAGQTEATLKALEKIYRDLNPAFPFSYNFLDEGLDNLYKGEKQLGAIFNVFAILAILISTLGLYGLSAFLAEQRTKEIGVRKVLGASVFNVVYLLSTGFTRLISIAILLAIPIAWIAINNWLKSFAYHIQLSWVIFLIAAVSALMIAWLTVSYESIKAAIANPVKSLRSE